MTNGEFSRHGLAGWSLALTAGLLLTFVYNARTEGPAGGAASAATPSQTSSVTSASGPICGTAIIPASVPATNPVKLTPEDSPYGTSKKLRYDFQIIRPAYTDELLVNPHIGTTTFQRFNGDPLYPGTQWNDSKGPTSFPAARNKDLSNGRYPPTRISYCRWLWSVIEPEKGKFRWDIVDQALKTAAERGQTLQVRIQPFIWNDTPKWYWDTGAKRDESDRENRNRNAIDHNDPLYLKHWGDHIRAWGARYDGHPNLESFDIAYGGFCGEGGGNASPETAKKLVDVYLEAFKKTQLISMLGTPGNSYGSTIKDRNLGWRADCFGDLRGSGPGGLPLTEGWNHMYQQYPQQTEDEGVKDAWKTAPVIFETGWTVPHWREMGWNIDEILAMGLKYHVSVFMPKSVFIPDEDMPKVIEFSKRMGYRFFVQQMTLPLAARPGRPVRTEVTIDNRGVAPIYRPYAFALRFSQDGRHYVVRLTQDIRKWLPDYTVFRERFDLPGELSPGLAMVSCGIVDDQNNPVVRLAIKSYSDGWHPLTFIDILPRQPASQPK